MAKLSVKVKSNHTPQDTFSKLADLLDNVEEIKSFDPTFAVSLDQANLKATAKGKKLKGDFTVFDEGDTSSVEVNLDIPMALFPFKGKIQSVLERKVEKALS
jgi:hypothetical protein